MSTSGGTQPESDSSASSQGDTQGADTETSEPATSGRDTTGDETSDDTTSTSTDSDTGQSSTGDPACEGQCAPNVPAGWEGPVIVRESEGAASPCPGDFPTLVHDAQHTNLNAGAAVCDCSCGEVNGATCGSATLTEAGNNCVGIAINPDTWVLAPGACTFVNMPPNDYGLTPPPLQTAGASCMPMSTEVVPTPAWDNDVRSCAAVAGDTCDGGTCLPATPPEYALCIFVDGEAGCPAGRWSQQRVTHAAFVDERDCSACSCGVPQGTCGGTATFTSPSCGAGSAFNGELSAGACGDLPGSSHAQWVPEVDATCTPSGGQVTGAVTPSGTITYCCA